MGVEHVLACVRHVAARVKTRGWVRWSGPRGAWDILQKLRMVHCGTWFLRLWWFDSSWIDQTSEWNLSCSSGDVLNRVAWYGVLKEAESADWENKNSDSGRLIGDPNTFTHKTFNYDTMFKFEWLCKIKCKCLPYIY